MLQGNADGEVVESDVALVSVPAGTIGKSASRSCASTPNLSSAFKKAASSMKAQKSKNTLNKIKDCKSITGAIMQLIDGMKESSHNNHNYDMSARVNMLLMHQMDAMDRWMDKHDHRDHKEKHKERKRERKCREKCQGKRRQLLKRYLIMEESPW
jgi:hypothetical protein